MNFKSHIVRFSGYWLNEDRNGIPDQSGVYCVYNCVNMRENNTVFINSLLYIGEAKNVRERILGHNELDEWKSHCATDQELCFSFGTPNYDITSEDRKRIEAALIFKHHPPCNKNYINSFPYPETQIQTKGENFLLLNIFKVFPE